MKNNIRRSRTRQNYAQNFVLNFFIRYSSYPRLMLEVFVRKNLGRRYFNMFSAMTVVAILLIIPQLLFKYWYSPEYKMYVKGFWDLYLVWYLFTGAFFTMSIIRWIEILQNKNRQLEASTYPGDPFNFMYSLRFLGKANERTIAIRYEPFLFFIAGFILIKCGQGIGYLILFSSIFYSIGNYAEFKYGDEYIIDMEDQMKLNEALQDSFAGRDLSPKIQPKKFVNGSTLSKGQNGQTFPNGDEPTVAL